MEQQNLVISHHSQVHFDKEFFMRMFELEKIFYDKHINIEQIGKLVAMNARCVEYYDSIKDNSKYYYMNKIQYILSRKESLQQIMKESKKIIDQQQKSNQKVQDDNLLSSEYVIDLNYSDPTKDDREFKINNITCSFTDKNDLSESVNRRKLQGEYKMNIHYYEQNQEEQVKHIVEESEVNFFKNDEIIKKELQNQDETMMQRIAKKKACKSQKQTKLKRANSFDDSEINQNERIKNKSDCLVQRNNNQNIQEIQDQNSNIDKSKNLTVNKQISDANEKTKEKEINYLKQSFNHSYQQLFDSINKKYNPRPSSKRLSTFDLDNLDGDIKFTYTNSQIIEDNPNQLTRGSSGSGSNHDNHEQNLLDNLEGLLSTHGGETNISGNPFEENENVKENNQKIKKSVRFDEKRNKHMS